MKKLNKFFAVLVALAMMATLCVSMAFAVGEGESEPPASSETTTSLADTTGKVTTSKKIWIAQGLAYPENTTIKISGNNKDGNTSATLPTVADVTISTSNTTDTDADGFVVKNGAIDFASIFNTTTKHPAGVYTYEVTENTTSTTSGVKYNKDASGMATTDKYYVSVYVKADGTIGFITVGTELDDNGAVKTTTKVTPNPGSDEDQNDGDDVESGLIFNNTYTKTADDTDDPNDNSETDKFSFVVTKDVSGDYSSTDLAFPFQVTITLPATAKADNITLGNLTAKANGVATAIDTTTGVATFSLKAGQSFTVDNAPVGTTYTVVEQLETKANEEASYKKYTAKTITSTSYLNNKGVATSNYSATNATDDATKQGLDYTVTNALVADGGSTTAYTNENTQDNTPPTGILISNLPYIALALVAIGGLIAYVVVRRKADDEA